MKRMLLLSGALFLISAAMLYSAITQVYWPVSIVYSPPQPVAVQSLATPSYEYVYEWVYIYFYPDELLIAEPQPQAAVFPLDLNRATREELMLIPGIGEVISGRIVQYREVLGGYTTLTQLTEISGISYNTLERIAGYLVITQGYRPVLTAALPYEYESDEFIEELPQAAVFPLDLNRATREELMLIPGIGEVLSGRIVQHRELLGGYTTLTQLTEVSGISYNTLNRIAGYLFVAD